MHRSLQSRVMPMPITKRAASFALLTLAVTFVLSDIVDSTGLLQQLGDGYPRVLNDVRRHLRTAVRRAGGREVDAGVSVPEPLGAVAVGAVAACWWLEYVRARGSLAGVTGKPLITPGERPTRIILTAVGLGLPVLATAALLGTACSDSSGTGGVASDPARQHLNAHSGDTGEDLSAQPA